MNENGPKIESFDAQVSRLAEDVEKTMAAAGSTEKNPLIDKAMGVVMVTEFRKIGKEKIDEHKVIKLYNAVLREVERRQKIKKMNLSDDLLPKNTDQEGQEQLPLE